MVRLTLRTDINSARWFWRGFTTGASALETACFLSKNTISSRVISIADQVRRFCADALAARNIRYLNRELHGKNQFVCPQWSTELLVRTDTVASASQRGPRAVPSVVSMPAGLVTAAIALPLSVPCCT